jgi:hypothetical protein
MIALNLHPPAPTISELSSSQFLIDQLLIDWYSCGQPLNDRDQRSSV